MSEQLPGPSRDALAAAEVVAGAKRHLALLGDVQAETLEWPVPFEEGIEQLLALKGRKVVMLASGNPFWFGAGSVLTCYLHPAEWSTPFPRPADHRAAA